MAKSKRNKVVPLTKVGKKKDSVSNKKAQIVTNIEQYLNTYEFCFVFIYKNMTSVPMQELRNYWNTSKFVIGKNKVLQVSLGKNEEDEVKLNSHKLSKYLNGNCGLFFTNEEPEKVLEYFENFSCPYYGNVGTVSSQTVIIPAGKPKELESFPPSMESQFRVLGMQIKLEGGKFYLLSDYVVCEAGANLSPEQSKMIRHLGIQMDEFKIYIQAYLKRNGEFKETVSTQENIEMCK